MKHVSRHVALRLAAAELTKKGQRIIYLLGLWKGVVLLGHGGLRCGAAFQGTHVILIFLKASFLHQLLLFIL